MEKKLPITEQEFNDELIADKKFCDAISQANQRFYEILSNREIVDVDVAKVNINLERFNILINYTIK